MVFHGVSDAVQKIVYDAGYKTASVLNLKDYHHTMVSPRRLKAMVGQIKLITSLKLLEKGIHVKLRMD